MPTVLITGAAGFIGMHTTLRFLYNKWDVIGIDDLNDYYSVKLKQDRLRILETSKRYSTFRFFKKSLLDDDLFDLLNDYNFDAVIHLAAQAGVRYSIENPFTYQKTNIEGFLRIIDYVKERKIGKFIYASSSSVYGKTDEQPLKESADCSNPESFYAATKLSNELMASAYFNTHGLSSIGLRFFTVYGPWGRPDMAPMLFLNATRNKEAIKVFNFGNQSRDFTYIDDIVEAIYRIINKSENVVNGPLVFNIGNGKPVNLMDFIRIIEKESGVFLKKELVPAQPGDVEKTYADVSKLEGYIGCFSKTSIESGIVSLVRWFNEYYGIERNSPNS